MNHKLATAVAALTLGALALAANAQGSLGSSSAQRSKNSGSQQQGQQQGPQDGQRKGGRPHGPPPEAIAACSGQPEQATCAFTGRNGEALTGTCMGPPPDRPAPKDAPIACRPSNNRPSQDGGQGGNERPPPDQQPQ